MSSRKNKIIKDKRKGNCQKTVIGTKYSTDNEKIIWNFDMLDSSGYFSFDLSRNDFNHREILEKIILYSNMTWSDVKKQTHDNGKSKHHFLELDKLSHIALDRVKMKQLSETHQESIFSFALQNKLRIIGIRDGRYFHVIWFDPNHEFCPSKKK